MIMVDNPGMILRGPGSARSSVLRAELINAIADLAIEARAGTLLRAYQREWAWVDKQNYRDAVDADEFNGAFHGIEREFDKLADLLAQGAGGLPAPEWDSGEVTITRSQLTVRLDHNLGSTDLLVDLKVRLDPFRHPGLPIEGQKGWTNRSVGDQIIYALPDPNKIVIVADGRLFSSLAPDLVVRALLWTW
jgi:hypothetical protein